MSRQSTEIQEILEVLECMIKIPSVEGKEQPLSDYIADYTSALGMEVLQPEALPGRCNVIAKRSFGKGGKTVVLNAHMDVVPVAEGWKTDPFKMTVVDGIAYGRGVADCKGGLACLLIAVKRLIGNQEGLNGQIIYTGVIGEETNSYGARHLVKDGLKADFCIVGEPTECKVAICHNGSIRPIIQIQGLTSHSSTPQYGINAIRIAAYISSMIDEWNQELALYKHKFEVGKPSVAITMIKGGVQENVIPDNCEIVIDRRMAPGENEEEIIQRINKLCTQAEAAFPGSKVKVRDYIVTTGPASETSPDLPDVKTAYSVCQSVTGVKQTPWGLTCNTDMNHFVRCGIPTIILGPGSIDVAHKPNEFVSLKDLAQITEIYEKLLRELLK